MLNWNRTILTTGSLCLLLLSTTLSVEAKPARQKKPASTTTTIYQQAKKELPEDFYTLYRVIDRIARANELDNRPWRVVAVPEYNVNAFATDVNLVAIYDGILDQLAGDSSALACVVAHEMGHHTKRHIAVGAAQRTELIAKIQEEATKEVLGEKEAANQEATAATVGGVVVNNVVGGRVGGLLGSVLGNQGARRQADSQKRINEIVEKKKKELEERLAAQERQQEFEADEIGYIASVKAGFEPEGCLRVMESDFFRGRWAKINQGLLTSIIPKTLKLGRCKFGVTNCVLNIFMPQVTLNCSGINTSIRQIITCSMPQHMSMNRERQTS